MKRMRMEWYEGSEDCWMQDDPEGPYVEFGEAHAEIEKLKARVAELEERELLLRALEDAGVDNWHGFGYARELLEEWRKESKT